MKTDSGTDIWKLAYLSLWHRLKERERNTSRKCIKQHMSMSTLIWFCFLVYSHFLDLPIWSSDVPQGISHCNPFTSVILWRFDSGPRNSSVPKSPLFLQWIFKEWRKLPQREGKGIQVSLFFLIKKKNFQPSVFCRWNVLFIAHLWMKVLVAKLPSL